MAKINFLQTLIKQNLQKYLQEIGDQTVAVIVSGGIDSSIIAVMAQQIFFKIQFFSMVSPRSADLPFVEILEKRLSQTIHKIYLPTHENISSNDLTKIKNILVNHHLKTHLTAITLAFGFKLLFSKISQENISHILTGQGPDILLAGYHRYKTVNLNQLIPQIKKDLPLLEIDIKRDTAMANLYQLKLYNAYLEKNFIKACQKLNGEDLIQQNENKFILRQLGKLLALPKEIVQRPKKAFQYSTGLQKVILKKIRYS